MRLRINAGNHGVRITKGRYTCSFVGNKLYVLFFSSLFFTIVRLTFSQEARMGLIRSVVSHVSLFLLIRNIACLSSHDKVTEGK